MSQEHQVAPSGKFIYPTLLPEQPAPDGAQIIYWKTLRAFFRTGKGGGLLRLDGRQACYPALLAPYLSAPHTGPYPCWIGNEPGGAKPALIPLRTLIEQQILALAPDKSESITLKDNLLRLHILLEKKFAGSATPEPPQSQLDEVLDELIVQLDLKGREGDAFLADIDRLRKMLPQNGVFIPLSPWSPLHLLAALIDLQTRQQQEILKKNIEPLAIRIRQLIDVERGKDPAAHSATALEANMDFAGSYLKFEELASLLPSGGSVVMPEERLHRLEHLLQILENAESTLFGQKPAMVIAQSLADRAGIDLPALFATANAEIVPDEKVFERITNLFDQSIPAIAALFAAIRIARLELEDHYQHEVHGDVFAQFTYADFSEAEFALCPPFILLVHGPGLARTGLNDFAALLASRRPVKCLALQFDALEPAPLSGKSLPVFRPEPVALAIAQRDTYVLQTTIADPVRLFDSFWEGFNHAAPAFFNVLSSNPDHGAPGAGLIWASAALGGRAFPSFVFNCRKGSNWSSRFDIGNNPRPERDWPDELLLHTASDGATLGLPTPFTFADFAALDPDFGQFFHPVPANCWSDELIPLADYLSLPEATALTKIPFIWMVDDQNRLQKTAVALPLVQTCLERLDYWHFLQEIAGIQTRHVGPAAEQPHQADAPAVQNVPETPVIQNVSADQGEPIVANTPAAKIVIKEKTAPGKAWIESSLCTSCNECIHLNDRIFKYNREKQAYIANAAGGPFADIVSAAENCPVSIIHPGAPLNPDEKGLDALIRRAARFSV